MYAERIFSILSIRMIPFPIYWVVALLGGMLHFYSYFNRTLCKQTLKTRYRLILGLHYLHMSHKNLFNHLNGLYITLNVCPFIISRYVKVEETTLSSPLLKIHRLKSLYFYYHNFLMIHVHLLSPTLNPPK